MMQMDTSDPAGIAKLVGVGLLAVYVLWSLVARFLPSKKPPMAPCMPLIGGVMRFIAGPMKMMAELYPSLGDVWTVPVFHKRITFLIGPAVSSHFFKATDEQLSQKEVYEFNVPTFGKGVVFDVDHKVRNEQFRFFAESLKASKLRTYVGMMVVEAEAFFKNWGDEGEVDINEELSNLIINTASRCLMGREVRENLHGQVWKHFHDLDKGMRPYSVLWPYAPTPAHRQRDKARKALSDVFRTIIDRRRASGIHEEDLLQTFIDAKYKDGRSTTTEECVGMLIATLFAGQHTSSATSAWTVMNLVHHPQFLPGIIEEQKAVMKEYGSTLDYDILQKMDRMHWLIKESLRLSPPLIMLMRYVHAPFTVTSKSGKEYVIPKGDIVATSPGFAHRTEVFTNPEKFDPERYAPGREEDKKAPFSFIGFGGGRHGCMGELFAYMQIKCLMSIILRDFELTPVSPLPVPDYEAMVVGPKGECRVKFRRRKLTA